MAEPRRDRTVKLSDVARHAGVSPMTVSRVINGEASVRESTKERVLESVHA
ncbi:MAG: LacI family DNA-binding transcriptional regulator, partial [Parvularculaceae bacterium]|nr:LacI family DNA-binding transcriptional regulator [Parvularculaceae bacterium]